MDHKRLADIIKETRENSGMSIRALARLAGISAPFLSDIELGRRFPSDEVLTRLAKCLRVSVEDLKQHDTRVSINALKRLVDSSPTWGFALKTMTERVAEGKLTPEELLKKLAKAQ